MEKIGALIDKLQELKTTGATLQSISYYVQLLQAEILHARSLERERERELQRRQSHIAVILPGAPLAEPEVTVDSNGHITAPQFTSSEPIQTPEYKRPEPPTPEPVGIIEPSPIVNQPVAEKHPDPIGEQSQASPDATPNINQPAAEKHPEQVAEPSQTPLTTPSVSQPAAEKQPELDSLKAYQSSVPTLETLKAYQSPAPEQDALKAYRSPAQEPVPVAPAATQPPVTVVPPAPEPLPTQGPTPKEDEKQPVFIHLFGDANQPVVTAVKPEKNEKQEKPETNGFQSELKELNQKVAQNIPSLNDRLRQTYTEIGDRFNDMPVKDLRQAIGINDKFQFIQELFRGDVDTYERSVKTINEMQSIQEAEYWIERELKIRQGWIDDNRVVRQFYALVKKRFS